MDATKPREPFLNFMFKVTMTAFPKKTEDENELIASSISQAVVSIALASKDSIDEVYLSYVNVLLKRAGAIINHLQVSPNSVECYFSIIEGNAYKVISRAQGDTLFEALEKCLTGRLDQFYDLLVKGRNSIWNEQKEMTMEKFMKELFVSNIDN